MTLWRRGIPISVSRATGRKNKGEPLAASERVLGIAARASLFLFSISGSLSRWPALALGGFNEARATIVVRLLLFLCVCINCCVKSSTPLQGVLLLQTESFGETDSADDKGPPISEAGKLFVRAESERPEVRRGGSAYCDLAGILRIGPTLP